MSTPNQTIPQNTLIGDSELRCGSCSFAVQHNHAQKAICTLNQHIIGFPGKVPLVDGRLVDIRHRILDGMSKSEEYTACIFHSELDLPLYESTTGDKLDRGIIALGFSDKIFNTLLLSGIRTIRDLCTKSEPEIRSILQIGRKGLNEIKEVLASQGLSLSEV